MSKERKEGESIREWLKKLKSNKAGAIDVHSIKVGVDAGTVAAMASKQINAYFDKYNTDILILRRRELPVLFGKKGLVKNIKMPRFRPYVIKHFRAYGISVEHKRSGYAVFRKIKQKVNPNI